MEEGTLDDADAGLLPWAWPGDAETAAGTGSGSGPRLSSTRISIFGLGIRRSAFRRWLKMAVLLALCLLVFWALSARARPAYSDGTFRWGAPSDSPSPSSSTFAPTRQTDLRIHDPSIIYTAGSYYSYSVGPHITVHSAPALAGPWRKLGTVLTAESVIPKGDRKAPWAPATVQVGDRFYCYYAVSNAGCRDSAIGVASSSTSPGPGPGTWTDHGLLIQSGNGEGADAYPLDQSNTIDPSVFVDDVPGGDGSAYLNFGSFWTGIWQVRLSGDMLSVQGGGEDARHLAAEPTAVFPARKNADRICGDRTGGHPVEGSFLSFHGGWYYLWFSWGRCCEFREERLRKNGKEYRIRVGRSKSPRGPFVDKQGKDLVDGGGETVYGSNGELFAPGGQGVLTDELGDILYYHYLNTSISYDFWEARLGYNRLEYVDGWPVAQ